MLGVDSNVLVRYLTRDDQPQYEMARRLINRGVGKGEPVLVSLPVLPETEWVLRSRYEFVKSEINYAEKSLRRSSNFPFIYIWLRDLGRQ